MLAEVVDTLVLQPYGIEHPRWGLGHTRIRIPLARMQRRPLDHDPAEALQLYEVLVL